MRVTIGLTLCVLLIACSGPARGPESSHPTDAGSAADGGPRDAGTPACTFGMDQTCNGSDLVSSLWGQCSQDGTCSCHAGFETDPATGKCRPQGSYDCGDTFCTTGNFCVDRVHARDGGSFSTWECMPYFGCTATDCSCATASFVSQSCINPSCAHEAPEVALRCDDLN